VIEHFRLLDAHGQPYRLGDFGSLAGTRDGQAMAWWNGAMASNSESVQLLAASNPDVAQQVAGLPGLPARENNFAAAPAAQRAPGTYGGADQAASGNALGAGGAAAATRADAALAENGSAFGYAAADTSTTLRFALSEEASITFAFDALPYTAALVSDDAVANANAQLYWRVSLFDISTDMTVFSYAPDALNGWSNAGSGDGAARYDPGRLHLSATTGLLAGGNTYQITIEHSALAMAVQERLVPEPASLALVGLGLLALWRASWRASS
jgi:hypothetical protein